MRHIIENEYLKVEISELGATLVRFIEKRDDTDIVLGYESDEEYKSEIYDIYSNVFLSKTLQAKNTADSIILRVDDLRVDDE